MARVFLGRVALAPLIVGTMASSGLAQTDPSTTTPGFYAGDPVLQAYVSEALSRSPSVREAAAQYRAALEMVPQMTALPEPMVTFTQALRRVETRVGPQVNAVTLSQSFPWFGTLDLRGQVAVQTATARAHQYEARQRDLIADVKDTFYNLAYVDAASDLTREEHALLVHYEDLAEARYASGQGLQQGVIKLQAELTKVDNRLRMLAQQRDTLAARLNTLRDYPPEQPVPSAGPLQLPDVALDLDVLYRQGVQSRPELQASAALIQRDERAIDLARKQVWPNLTLGLGFQNVGRRGDPAGVLAPPPDNGKNALTLSLGGTVPLRRDKYRAAVAQAREDLTADRESYARVQNEMEFAVRDATLRMQALRDQIDLFEQVLLPQVEEALRATEAAYETTQLGVLDLLDSERTRLDVRMINARYYADYLVALARLERAIGTAVPIE